MNSEVNTFRSVPTLTPSLKLAFVGTAVDWVLALKIVNATAPTATITEIAIPSWMRTRLSLSPFCCCSLRALALARAASRCSDLVGLGVFEVIWVVYNRFLGPKGPVFSGLWRCDNKKYSTAPLLSEFTKDRPARTCR